MNLLGFCVVACCSEPSKRKHLYFCCCETNGVFSASTKAQISINLSSTCTLYYLPGIYRYLYYHLPVSIDRYMYLLLSTAAPDNTANCTVSEIFDKTHCPNPSGTRFRNCTTFLSSTHGNPHPHCNSTIWTECNTF